jgi:hypothetical protein
MAEDLGKIRIEFGGMGAGGASGPEATRKTTDEGGGLDISTIIRAVMGDVSAMIEIVVKQVTAFIKQIVALIDQAIQFVKDTVSDIRERGKFAPGVLQESAAMQIQQLQAQFREANVLGPLYQTILRWYRELMRMLEPWRLLLSALFAVLTGVLIKTMTAILSLLNSLLVAILQGIVSMVKALRDLIQYAASGAVQAAVAGSGLITAISPTGAAFVDWLTGGSAAGSVGSAISGIAGGLDNALQALESILNGILKVAKNTTPPPAGAEWAAAQLRDISSRSPLYPAKTGAPSFWHPPGSAYP